MGKVNMQRGPEKETGKEEGMSCFTGKIYTGFTISCLKFYIDLI